jgi:hypothetical protein
VEGKYDWLWSQALDYGAECDTISSISSKTHRATKRTDKTTKPKEETKGKEMAKEKLYQVTGKEIYGTLLAVNSKGGHVLELKGTGEVRVYPKDELEEVVPYTVGVNFPNNGRVYAFESTEGLVEEGDVIMLTDYDNQIVVVKSVGTKDKSATKRLVGRKLLTKKID